MEYFNRKYTSITELYTITKELVTRMKPLIKELYNAELLALTKLLEDFDKVYNSINLADKKENFIELFHSLEVLVNFLNKIHGILESLDIYTTEHATQLSKHYVMESISEYNKYNKRFYELITAIYNMNKDMIPKIGELFYDVDIKIVQDMFRKYPFSIELYAIIMQHKIDNSAKHDMSTLLKQIEDDKLFVMYNNFDNGDIPSDKKINTIQFRTFGFIPVTSALATKDLANFLTVHISGDKKLNSIASALNVCIIAINKIIPKPMYYDISKITSDASPMEKFEGPTLTAVNNFNILKHIDSSADKYDFSIEYYGNIDAEKFIVLDVLAKNVYRILAPWYDIKQYMIPRSKMSALLDYIKNGYRLMNRIDGYNSLVMQDVVKCIFTDKSIDIAKLEKESEIYEAKYMRNIIYNDMLIMFGDEVRDKTIDAAEFSRIVHHDMFQNKLYSIIIDKYNEYISGSKNIYKELKFPLSETVVSFLLYLDHLLAEFRKEFHSQYDKNKPNAAAFNKGIQSFELKKIFETMLLNTLTTIITDSSNVYRTLLYKYRLLSV